MHLLVGVEADEAVVRLARRPCSAISSSPGAACQAVVEPVVEDVAHGDELDVLVGVQGLLGRPGAAAAAADQADLERVAAGGVNVRGRRTGGGAGDGPVAEEVAAGGGMRQR